MKLIFVILAQDGGVTLGEEAMRLSYAELIRVPSAGSGELPGILGAGNLELAMPTPPAFRLTEMGKALATLGVGHTPDDQEMVEIKTPDAETETKLLQTPPVERSLALPGNQHKAHLTPMKRAWPLKASLTLSVKAAAAVRQLTSQRPVVVLEHLTLEAVPLGLKVNMPPLSLLAAADGPIVDEVDGGSGQAQNYGIVQVACGDLLHPQNARCRAGNRHHPGWDI